MTKYWLMKSEPSVYSIDDLRRDGFTTWEGVRNYQARNFLRDEMKSGDLAFFYHSNASPPGIAGICRICKEAFPDSTAFNPDSTYYDPKSNLNNVKWYTVEVEFVEKFPHLVSLEELRSIEGLEDLLVLKKGSRLSVQPVSQRSFEIIRNESRRNMAV